ncbi:MAG: tyrosine-protein phosphatase [archaeon]|nr:tyrosine-protein phosphatase [archaeon]
MSKKKRRYQADGFDLDLTWILPRIIAMGFPSLGQEALYRNKLSSVRKLLNHYHQDNWKVYNLCSERAYPPEKLAGRVARYGFDDHNPPLLPTLAALVEDAVRWLGLSEDHVVAIHCKAGKGRTGVAVACLLLSLGLCADAESALDFFGQRRARDGKGVTIPSQVRFVHYWERVALRFGGVVPPPPDLPLWGIRMTPFPKGMASATLYLAICCDQVPVFSSEPIERTSRDHHVDFNTYGMAVRGHLKISIFLRPSVGDDELLAQFWLYTSFLDSHIFQLSRDEIDVVNKDKKGRFGMDFSLTAYFGSLRLPSDRASFQREALGCIVLTSCTSTVITEPSPPPFAAPPPPPPSSTTTAPITATATASPAALLASSSTSPASTTSIPSPPNSLHRSSPSLSPSLSPPFPSPSSPSPTHSSPPLSPRTNLVSTHRHRPAPRGAQVSGSHRMHPAERPLINIGASIEILEELPAGPARRPSFNLSTHRNSPVGHSPLASPGRH